MDSFGRPRPTPVKQIAYESGIPPLGDARERFSVKFYMVAMLFILFDVEAVFLYPWAVILRQLKMFGFYEMLVYILVILVGLSAIGYGLLRAGWPRAPFVIGLVLGKIAEESLHKAMELWGMAFFLRPLSIGPFVHVWQ